MRLGLFFFFAAIFSGCETVVEIDVPLEESKITINSFFSPDSVWKARLNLSHHILYSEIDFSTIKDAVVIVYHDGTPIDTLVLDKTKYYIGRDSNAGDTVFTGNHRSKKGLKPVVGEVYQIVASAGDLETVSAGSFAPFQTHLDTVHIRSTTPGTGERRYNHVITVTFTDNGTQANFYEFQLFVERTRYDPWQQDSITYVYRAGIFTDNQTFNQGLADEVIFSNRVFSGKQVTFSIKADVFEANKLFLSFRTISEDLYHYKLTSGLQDQTADDPFAQPVNVYNNINHGYGIFAGYSERVYELESD
jgi:hypothetical protein